MNKDKARIIALQAQVKIARSILEKVRDGDRLQWDDAENALYEMDKLEWSSKPNLIQDGNQHYKMGKAGVGMKVLRG